MKVRAKKPGYIPFRGTYVSPKGKAIYEALEAGKTWAECVREFGVPEGTMSGFAERARKMGIITSQRPKRVIVAVSMMKGSEGNTYEMFGYKQVSEFGFDYRQAWAWAKKKIERNGYLWYFKGEL